MDATLGLPILVGLIAVALLFDFLNGLHDAANSIATIVSTRVLRPQYAVFWAAFFNFVAFSVFGLNVAHTIGTGIVEPSVIDTPVIFAALVGAIVWNLITWGLGIPSSSSHALIGGLVGGGMAKAGLSAAVWGGLTKTLLAIVLSPLLGFVLAMVLVAIVSWASVRSTPFAVDRARSGFFRPFIDPITAYLREAATSNGNEALRNLLESPRAGAISSDDKTLLLAFVCER